MPSFDVVNKIDPQTLDNIINVAKKDILNRYDFRDSKSTVELDKKNNSLQIVTENSMRLEHIIDTIQGVDPKALNLGKEEYASGNMIRKDISIQVGIDKEIAKKLIKDIKSSKSKVIPAIMDDMVRVTGKKIDDLQEIIALLRTNDYGIPLQFVNMKS
jgi:uncharacterized protein YajQ (UPF0234 family)